MSAPQEIVDQLKGTVLFARFTDAELAELVALLEPTQVAKDAIIVKQDEVGECMYILAAGEASVLHHGESQDIELATLKAGDFFGELSLVDHGLRSADVVALTDCTLVKVTEPHLHQLSGAAAAKFFIAVGRILVARFRESNERYIDTRERYLDTKQRYIDSMLYPVYGNR